MEKPPTKRGGCENLRNLQLTSSFLGVKELQRPIVLKLYFGFSRTFIQFFYIKYSIIIILHAVMLNSFEQTNALFQKITKSKSPLN